jgi:hypothetical protein
MDRIRREATGRAGQFQRFQWFQSFQSFVGFKTNAFRYRGTVVVIRIILQGAFEQTGDLIGVVAERTTAPGSKQDPASLI